MFGRKERFSKETGSTDKFQNRCSNRIESVISQSDSSKCQVRRQSFSVLLCQVGLDKAHQIEQVIAQRELVVVKSLFLILPYFQSILNSEQNKRRRLETGQQRLLLCVQAVSLKLCVFRLQTCLKINVFGGVCQEGVHPSVNDALAEDLESFNPSLEVR